MRLFRGETKPSKHRFRPPSKSDVPLCKWDWANLHKSITCQTMTKKPHGTANGNEIETREDATWILLKSLAIRYKSELPRGHNKVFRGLCFIPKYPQKSISTAIKTWCWFVFVCIQNSFELEALNLQQFSFRQLYNWLGWADLRPLIRCSSPCSARRRAPSRKALAPCGRCAWCTLSTWYQRLRCLCLEWYIVLFCCHIPHWVVD